MDDDDDPSAVIQKELEKLDIQDSEQLKEDSQKKNSSEDKDFGSKNLKFIHEKHEKNKYKRKPFKPFKLVEQFFYWFFYW